MNPNEPIRDARKLGTPKMLVLGLQHMFAMFGATILVPILVQQYGLPLDIQTTLFFAGIGTLFFHVCTKFRVPAFLGSSFAFLGGFSTMANLNTGIYADMSPQDKLAYTCGGIVVAGLLYLALALVIRLVAPPSWSSSTPRWRRASGRAPPPSRWNRSTGCPGTALPAGPT